MGQTVMWVPNAVNSLLPFKLIVFKYLLNVLSEEAQCQLEEAQALCCPKGFGSGLTTNSQKAEFDWRPSTGPAGSPREPHPAKRFYQILPSATGHCLPERSFSE